MSARANMRLNFEGNVEDEQGGSYYVVDEEGNRTHGPFGSAPYALTVRERAERKWPGDLEVEYEP